MNESAVPILNDALIEYYNNQEILDLCNLYDVDPEIYDYDKNYLILAQKLIIENEINNNHKLLKDLYDSLLSRSKKQIASVQGDYKRDYHKNQLDNILKIAPIVESSGLPSEITVPEKRPFSAKSEVRELLQSAKTEIIIIDPYVGHSTLDCLRGVQQPVRLLTGNQERNIEKGFDNVLRDFISEGYDIEIRRHNKLHDRHICFNERCWLIGSSLKDAGKKCFNIIEFIDYKKTILDDINLKWRKGKKYGIH